MSRRPSWACLEYEQHGDAVCFECLRRYEALSHLPEARNTLPPRVSFGQGWFSVGATHWFEASDATVFVSRDRRRVLARAVCGGICEVTLAWTPRLGNECQKCLRALAKARMQVPGRRADRSGSTGALQGELRRLYRGLTKPYEPSRVRRDRASGTDFTDCPYTALLYARGPKATVLVLEVPDGAARVSEELWFNSSAKRFMVWGAYDEHIVAQLAAKDLRAQIRRKGIITAPDEDKAHILRKYIEGRCREAVPDEQRH